MISGVKDKRILNSFATFDRNIKIAIENTYDFPELVCSLWVYDERRDGLCPGFLLFHSSYPLQFAF